MSAVAIRRRITSTNLGTGSGWTQGKCETHGTPALLWCWPTGSAFLKDMECPECNRMLQQTARGKDRTYRVISSDEARALSATNKAVRLTGEAAELHGRLVFAEQNPQPDHSENDDQGRYLINIWWQGQAAAGYEARRAARAAKSAELRA